MTEDEARQRVVAAMCPTRVCRTCGEPSRRLTVDRSNFDRQPALAAHIRERREALGVTSAEINGWFGYKEIAKNWERTDEHGARIPNLNEWPILKERLGLSDDFDDLVMGERRWTESLAEYVPHGDPARQNIEPKAQADYRLQQRVANAQGMAKGRATKIPKDAGFSDCGHDDWRPGVWLDPFEVAGEI